jgi:hypothetical protein
MRTDGQTHRHHVTNGFSQFREPAYEHYIPVYENIMKNMHFIEKGQLIREMTERLSLKHNMSVQWFLYPAKLSFMLSMPLKGFCRFRFVSNSGLT